MPVWNCSSPCSAVFMIRRRAGKGLALGGPAVPLHAVVLALQGIAAAGVVADGLQHVDGRAQGGLHLQLLLLFLQNVVFLDGLAQGQQVFAAVVVRCGGKEPVQFFQGIAAGITGQGIALARGVPGLLQGRRPVAARGVDAGNDRAEAQVSGVCGAIRQEEGAFLTTTGHDLRLAGKEGAALADKTAGGAVQAAAHGKAEHVQRHLGRIARRIIQAQRVGFARADTGTVFGDTGRAFGTVDRIIGQRSARRQGKEILFHQLFGPGRLAAAGRVFPFGFRGQAHKAHVTAVPGVMGQGIGRHSAAATPCSGG